jgi:16S rRNA (cytosine1402-N4)-methyltransferase
VQHKPVLLAEVLSGLAVKENGVYIDCTFGRGGHSREILRLLGDSGRLIAIDRDEKAVNSDAAKAMLKDERFFLKYAAFSEVEKIIADMGLVGQIDGILLDLGVSSPQLDDPKRGFSFMRDGPLDMRMNVNAGITAADWLAKVDEDALADILYKYGEERYARKIAKAVVSARAIRPIVTTGQLAGLIEHAVPVKDKYKHPATRSFQAIRIEINKELEELIDVLKQSIKIMSSGGRLVVISFQSLEDRIVKRFMNVESGLRNDPGKLPVKEVDIERGCLVKIGRAIKARESEIKENPRARSAIMRVAEYVNSE